MYEKLIRDIKACTIDNQVICKSQKDYIQAEFTNAITYARQA